ncbi:hypothetical protein [Streptosporangium sp. NPDC003464]
MARRARLIYRPERHPDHKSGRQRGFAWSDYRNPVESVWSMLRRSSRTSIAFTEPGQLLRSLRRGLREVQYRSDLVTGYLAATGLTLTTSRLQARQRAEKPAASTITALRPSMRAQLVGQ